MNIENKDRFIPFQKEEFKNYLKRRIKIRDSSVDLYVRVMNTFYLEKKNINQETIDEYIKMKPRHYIIAGLKHYCNFKKLKFKFPKKIKEPPQIKKGKVELSRIELSDMAEKIRDKDQDLYYSFKVFLYTGLRVQEVLNLKIDNFDFTKNEICTKTKGGIERETPIKKEFMKELYNFLKQKKLNESDYVFFTDKKILPHSRYNFFQRLIQKYFKNLSQKRLSALLKTHCFRKGVINYLIAEGMQLHEIKEFIGHSDIKTTEKYISDYTKKKTIRKCANILG